MLNSIFRLIVIALLAAIALVGLFVAWWIAVFALLALSAYFMVRRFLGKPVVPGGAVVIEGEYEVEREGGPDHGPNGPNGHRPARPRVVIDAPRPEQAP